MINDRRQLADVYQQTIDIVLEGHYTSENGEEVKLARQHEDVEGKQILYQATGCFKHTYPCRWFHQDYREE